MTLQLKQGIIDRIEQNPRLVGEIAVILKKHYTSMPQILKRNDAQLTQKAVLILLSQELKIKEDNLTEAVPEMVK